MSLPSGRAHTKHIKSVYLNSCFCGEGVNSVNPAGNNWPVPAENISLYPPSKRGVQGYNEMSVTSDEQLLCGSFRITI